MRLLLTTAITVLFIAGCGQSEHKHSQDHDKLHNTPMEHSKTPTAKEEVKLTKSITELAAPLPEKTKPKERADEATQTAEDVEAVKRDADRTLQDAISNGDLETIKQQLTAGANVNSKATTYVETPLLRAIFLEKKEVVKLLIENGANVSAENNENETPLMYASWSGKKDIVKLLLVIAYFLC